MPRRCQRYARVTCLAEEIIVSGWHITRHTHASATLRYAAFRCFRRYLMRRFDKPCRARAMALLCCHATLLFHTMPLCHTHARRRAMFSHAIDMSLPLPHYAAMPFACCLLFAFRCCHYEHAADYAATP